MKKYLFVASLLISSFTFAQEFYSQVYTAAGQFIKSDTHIEISDEAIILKSNDFDISYTVIGKIGEEYFKVETGNEPMAFYIQKMPGKIKKFKYTHTITVSAENQSDVSAISYYSVIKE